MQPRDELLIVGPHDVHSEPQPSVGGFVLGGLGDETPAFVAHLGRCLACRNEVADLAHIPSLLGRAVPARRRDADLRVTYSHKHQVS